MDDGGGCLDVRVVFSEGEAVWAQRLGGLRNRVRQELIAGQLAEHVLAGATVLDVGCGQGTQAVRLAARGCQVTGVDPSRALLELLDREAADAGVRVHTVCGGVEDLDVLVGDSGFDLVCAHGLLMYLDHTDDVLAALANHVKPGGLLSVTFRNGAALAFRPGMRGEWQKALDAFATTAYVNELGIAANAHHLDQVEAQLSWYGLVTRAWYGVRVFTDPSPTDQPVPTDGFQLLLRAEAQAARRDPYRQLASQIHLLSQRHTSR